MSIFQLQNRGEIRRSIGKNLGILIDGVVTSTEDKDTLIDTLNLTGGDDEYNERQVIIYDATGSIVDGETGVVSDFASATYEATLSANLSANITTGDKYEMWKTPWRIADINDAINQAIIEITNRALISRVTDSNFTLSGNYEYDWLVPYAFGNDFKALYKVEYVANVGTAVEIENCEAAWAEYVLPTYVTVTADVTYNIEGTYALKLAVTDGYSADDILATKVIDVDLTECDAVEITIRSSVALDAGDVILVLDDTAKCVSGTEKLSIPATLANTTTTHVIDLANPHLDADIISVGIEMEVDKDAITLYIDRIRGVKSSSKRYEVLSGEYWFIKRGGSPKFALTEDGLSRVGGNTQIRLSGFCAPDIFSDDDTDSEVDPAFLIAQTTGRLLISHAKSSYLDIHDRAKLATYWLGEANRMLPGLTPSLPGTTRSI